MIKKILASFSRGGLLLQTIFPTFSRLRQSQAVLAVFLLIVLSLFLIPIPRALLDLLIAANIILSLSLLLNSLFIQNPVKFSHFPTILLVTTLYRLALNVSSTRLILLHGDQGFDAAGQVIKSFGTFVVQGDFIVGAIIFAVIALINFIVIAKGSARIAEVAARFSLDALPGQQLAIDTDLRLGSISREEAETRRKALTYESRFFGTMDGAMRFVQGDAIATLIIACVNSLGGVAIGIHRGLSAAEAINTFGVLTIGDGLVSIIPALLISVSAGVITTRTHDSTTDSRRRREIRSDTLSCAAFAQIVEPEAILLSSLVLVSVSALLGYRVFIPFSLAFFCLLLILKNQQMRCQTFLEQLGFYPKSLFGHGLMRRKGEQAKLSIFPGTQSDESTYPGSGRSQQVLTEHYNESGVVEDHTLGAGRLQMFRLEVDSSMLSPYFQELDRGQESFDNFFNQVHAQVYQMQGVELPPLYLQRNGELEKGYYRILLREQVVRSGFLDSSQLFVGTNRSLLALFAIQGENSTRHPLDSRASAWVKKGNVGLSLLKRLEIEILEPYQYLVLDSVGAFFEVFDQMFGVDEVKLLFGRVRHQHRLLLEEVIDAGVITYSELADILRRLVLERVNIRDLKLILEGIAEYYSRYRPGEDRGGWLGNLHAFLRVVMCRSILSGALGPSGKFRTFTLSHELEDEFRSAIATWDSHRSTPPVDPEMGRALRNIAKKMFQPVFERGTLPVVIVCASDIRFAVQVFFQHQTLNAQWLRTIAFEEMSYHYRPESVGVLSL